MYALLPYRVPTGKGGNGSNLPIRRVSRERPLFAHRRRRGVDPERPLLVNGASNYAISHKVVAAVGRAAAMERSHRRFNQQSP
jgi:hypothetical protein